MTGKEEEVMVCVRLTKEMVEKIEEWRRKKGLRTRSETIRLAVKESLDRWLEKGER